MQIIDASQCCVPMRNTKFACELLNMNLYYVAIIITCARYCMCWQAAARMHTKLSNTCAPQILAHRTQSINRTMFSTPILGLALLVSTLFITGRCGLVKSIIHGNISHFPPPSLPSVLSTSLLEPKTKSCSSHKR